MAVGTRTPGCQHLFARFRGQTTIFYLGTCVASPEPEHHKARIPVMNDIAGRSRPFQVIKDGEGAIVYATMNRFDWPLLQSIRALDSANVFPSTPAAGNLAAGSEAANTRGTLVLGLTDFQLLIWWEYFGVAGASGSVNDAQPVRQYNSVEMLDMKEAAPGRAQEVACAFSCESLYSPTTRSFSGGVAGTAAGLYTENPAVIGAAGAPAALAALVQAALG